MVALQENNQERDKGFTILEILIAATLFLIIGGGVYMAYSNVLGIITIGRLNNEASFVAENEIEGIKNMPYEDIGTVNGAPAGKLIAEKTITSEGLSFEVSTTVRNIDDPFDGTADGIPLDTSPADYKLVEVKISCAECTIPLKPLVVTTTIAPKGLEGASKNGSLFINVFDAYGKPVTNADVSVVNTKVTPQININDTTNNNGELKLIDIATSSMGYEIIVNKNGYSSEKTYPLDDPGNPNPLKPHATVAKQEVTKISFSIDRVSSINFKTENYLCQPIVGVDFRQDGAKLIGTDPNILKYSLTTATDTGGIKAIKDIEWDTYSFTNLDSLYEISGTTPLMPLVVDPDKTYDLTWTMDSRKPASLLVIIQNDAGNLIDGAEVELATSSFGRIITSGERPVIETDWSGGNYASKSGNMETEAVPGQLTIQSIDGKYASNSQEWLVSSTVDLGTSSVSFDKIEWAPANQPLKTGPNSLKFQIASNNDNTTWNFIGPDGTANSFYASNSINIYSGHNSNRYLRYKVFMETANENYTPSLENISISLSSSCIPTGQAFFDNLNKADYTLTIKKTGYETYISNLVQIKNDWQEFRVTLIPIQ